MTEEAKSLGIKVAKVAERIGITAVPLPKIMFNSKALTMTNIRNEIILIIRTVEDNKDNTKMMLQPMRPGK